jgi:arginyl-tRNA synthetase
MLYQADSAEKKEHTLRREGSKAAQFSDLQSGGTFLRTAKFGDDEDRIVKRKDGRFVYLIADLAYHHDKFERGFDRMINVFGADHAGHVGRIRAGVKALDHDDKKLEFVLVQIVKLLRDNKEVRFSKRAGEVYTLSDFLSDVGSDAARFIFLMRSANAQFDFNLDLITKKNNENPVFYVQYGHARMATLLAKAHKENIVVDAANFSLKEQEALVLQEERELILKLSSFEKTIYDAAVSLEPHRLIFYCQDLVKIFHGYFTKYRSSERIISDDKVKTNARLCLVLALKQTIYNALKVLGISAPTYMQSSEEA